MRNALANDEPAIDRNVDEDDPAGERELYFSGEAGRIDDLPADSARRNSPCSPTDPP